MNRKIICDELANVSEILATQIKDKKLRKKFIEKGKIFRNLSGGKKMVKADSKVEYEDENGKIAQESYTNFELLEAKFDELKDVVDELSNIIRVNNLVRTEEIKAPFFDDCIVFESL